MKDKRLFIGIALTTAWIGVAGWTLMTQAHPDKLNEWGDFIAGFSAPLAFLWLVLGYMQQGEELQHSTRALHLQAEELRNSVEQQSQLVSVAREQMQRETEALAEERKLRREAARPKFIPQQSSLNLDGMDSVANFVISVVNIGPTATRFRLQIELPNSSVMDDGKALFKTEQKETYRFIIPIGATAKASIEYVDSLGNPGQAAFYMKRIQNKRLEFFEPGAASS